MTTPRYLRDIEVSRSFLGLHEERGREARNGDLRSPVDRLLSGGLPRRSAAAVAGSNFDHGGNEERIPGDVSPRETRVHRVLPVGIRRGSKGEGEKGNRRGER